MNTSKRYWLWILYCFLLILAVVLAILFRDNDPTGAGILSIKNLRICESDIYRKENSIDQVCGNVISNHLESLYVCGEFNYSKRGFNPNLYVFKDDLKYPIYYDSLPLRNTKNYCQKILLPHEERTGKYLIKLYYLRNLITSFSFTIP